MYECNTTQTDLVLQATQHSKGSLKSNTLGSYLVAQKFYNWCFRDQLTFWRTK